MPAASQTARACAGLPVGYGNRTGGAGQGGQLIEDFITHYGLIAVFLGCFLEGETAAITGGVMAHHGYLQLWMVVVTASVGAFVGDVGVFACARLFRAHPWVARQMQRPVVLRGMGRLNRNPHRLAGIFRFVPGMRIVGPLVLAQSSIGSAAYVTLAGIAAIVWAVIYTVFGVAIGDFLASVLGYLPRSTHVVIVAAALLTLAGGAALWHRRRKDRS